MARVLMANTPGDDEETQISYLACTFKLAKENKGLIKTTFINGNGWYTIKFKLQLDLINCVEKINKKKDEDFRILYLRGGPTEKQEKTESSNKMQQIQTQHTTTYKGKNITVNKNIVCTKKVDTKTINKNPYNLVEGDSPIGIGMMVGTFPGNNRKEQIAILAEIFGIPEDSNLINIEHRNGNSWFTGYFENEEERTHCIKKIEEVNKEIINLDASSVEKTFRIIKLEDIQIQKRAKNEIKRVERTDNREVTIQILDIPENFTTNRIKGALKSYGMVTDIYTQPMKRSALKSAKVTFTNFKIDLDQTWAIPMGSTMARIAPIQAQDDIFIQRNQLTARLYGIGKDCSAIRIMSAIKNTGAKTVHIPLNNRTGKKGDLQS
jgi:hypothetical protein